MPEEQNIRDLKLIQYLTEAHGKEQQLETALQAHIAMTTHKPYRRRLQQHLSETKRHARDVERRVKQLGGKVDSGISVGNPVEAVESVQTLAKKGAAMAQGPIHMIRGTGEAEKQLKNAKTEFANEAEEIATYKAIETLATAVGDKETAKLARTISRDEEKMMSFLERQIETLTKQVAREEIPAAARNGASRSRKKPATRKSATAGKSATARKKPAARKRSTTSAASRSRSTSSPRKRSGSTASKSGSSTASKRSGSSSSSRSRTTARKRSSSSSRNGASASSSRSSSTKSARSKSAARS
jgi:DNA-binding protein HU-beta